MQTWQSPLVPQLTCHDGEFLLYDSARRALVPVQSGSMYVCGITPYDATHLGHANTYVTFDLIARVNRDLGRKVSYASNVTDVDDPLLERAQVTGRAWQELASEQTDLFARDMVALRVIPPTSYEGVTECIPQVVSAVELMLAAGTAYRLEGTDDIYADVTADPKFGTVSFLEREAMLTLFAQRGGDPQRAGKRNALDPLLWRGARPGDPSWEGGLLGRGRPGWHIECAVIAQAGLGTSYEICGGGSDLLFPHHEMSEAHARALNGPQAGANLYVHAGMVGYQGEKMSKSKGNLVLVSRLLADGVDPMAIRLSLLAHHYRSDWEWTSQVLVAAQSRLSAWRRKLSDEQDLSAQSSAQASERFTHNGEAVMAPDCSEGEQGVIAAMRRALRNDLDAPAALQVVDEAQQVGPQVAAAIDALLGIKLVAAKTGRS